MAYRLAQAKYDPHTQRAYVELREEDSDGGDVVAVAVLRSAPREPHYPQIEQVVRKARHIFRKVGDTLSGG